MRLAEYDYIHKNITILTDKERLEDILFYLGAIDSLTKSGLVKVTGIRIHIAEVLRDVNKEELIQAQETLDELNRKRELLNED